MTPIGFLLNNCSQSFQKIWSKTSVEEVFFSKVTDLLKKGVLHGCISEEFRKISRAFPSDSFYIISKMINFFPDISEKIP